MQLPDNTPLMGFSTVGETEAIRIKLGELCKDLPNDVQNKIANLVLGFIKKSFMPTELMSSVAGNNPKKDVDKYIDKLKSGN